MAKETGDNAQVAAEQGDTTQLATETGDISQPATDTGDTTQLATEKGPVPYDRFKEVNDAKTAAEEKATLAEQRLQDTITQMNVAKANPQQEPTDLYTRVVNELGLQEAEWLTKEQNGQVISRMLEIQSVQSEQSAFIAQHADFGKVVGSQDPVTGQFHVAAPLQRVLNQKPRLTLAIKSSPYAAQLAYEMASKDVEYLKEKDQAGMTDAEKAAANAAAVVKAANQQASISSVQSGTGTLDRGAQASQWTPEQIEAYVEEMRAKAN